jgi:hypothetical protein
MFPLVRIGLRRARLCLQMGRRATRAGGAVPEQSSLGLLTRSCGFIMLPGESEGILMVKRFSCRLCLIEIEPIALADGTAAVVCVDCDLMGLAHEVAAGSPMRPAGLRPRTMRRLGRSPRRQPPTSPVH